MIGKNTKIAWGLTTSYVDAQDLFLEDVRGDTVREGNSYVPLRVITEQIRVRGTTSREPFGSAPHGMDRCFLMSTSGCNRSRRANRIRASRPTAFR